MSGATLYLAGAVVIAVFAYLAYQLFYAEDVE